ncbi:MAG: PAS domain S-box protein [Gemmatimonadaceae bacterium]|nr:PAS domain S-box protein [Gemmatimonadaceae bacterium]
MAAHEGATDIEKKLRGILSLAADAIISTDGAFRITMFNRAAERIFEYRAADVLGKSLDILLPESARTAHHQHLEGFRHSSIDAREMGQRGQIWGRRSSGELFPAEAAISKIRLGDDTHFTAVLRDVTRQRRAEQEREALLEREMRARATAEAAQRRIGFLSRASDLLHSSLAYEDTFGALLQLIVPEMATYCVVDIVEERGDVRRLHVVHEDPRMGKLCDRLRSYPRSQPHYMTRRAILGNTAEITHVTDRMLVDVAEDAEHLEILRTFAPESIMVVPLRLRDRKLGALLFARDHSREAYNEADLSLATELALRASSAVDNAQLYHRAQLAIRARDDVLGVVSHDLRNPLAVISMCAATLLESGFTDVVRDGEAMRTVLESTRWAQRLIQDLLDVAAIEAGGLSLVRRAEDPVLLVMKAALMFEELAAERSVRVVTELPEQLPPVYCDADRVMQAFGNLTGNALKFTPAGGEIRIAAADRDEHVLFSVSDNGPGIPDEDVPHIFDRFWTARRDARVRGTGMGLAIVRGIVEAHGGRVWAERNARGGATFNVSLPTAGTGTDAPSSRAR